MRGPTEYNRLLAVFVEHAKPLNQTDACRMAGINPKNARRVTISLWELGYIEPVDDAYRVWQVTGAGALAQSPIGALKQAHHDKARLEMHGDRKRTQRRRQPMLPL